MKIDADLVAKIHEIYTRARGFESSLLEAMILERHPGKGQDYNRIFDEFKRFAAMAAVCSKPLPMLSPAVDHLWHQFILCTEEYQGFCREYLGAFLHHAPILKNCSSEASFTNSEFRSMYKIAYRQDANFWHGKVTAAAIVDQALWSTDPNGSLATNFRCLGRCLGDRVNRLLAMEKSNKPLD